MTGATKETTLILVRHAVTDWNDGQRIQGQEDPPLSEHGREQARRLAAFLRDAGGWGEFRPGFLSLPPAAPVYTSDLRRARETAEILAQAWELPVEARPELREMCYGRWQGLTGAEVALRYPEEWQEWQANPQTARPQGGENMVEVQQRVVQLLTAMASSHPGETVLVVSHAGPLKAAICWALHLDLAERFRFNLHNCSLSVLTFPPGKEPRVDLVNFWV